MKPILNNIDQNHRVCTTLVHIDSTMAEVVGALYAVETVVEGAAAGALAVSGSTVPLHAKFQKIDHPTNITASSGSQAKLIKNKLYVIGGEDNGSSEGHGVRVLSFPPDFSTAKTDGPVQVDYEFQQPNITVQGRPLGTHGTDQEASATRVSAQHYAPWSRIKHSTVAIDDYIYIIGGFTSVSLSSRTSNSESIIPFDTIARYDTLTRTYTVIAADSAKCTEGLPETRYSASCTSSPYPPPLPGQSTQDHGTIFLHGGYDMSGQPLHDTWSFDLGIRAWHKLPTVVEEALEDKTAPGQVSYVEHRLWYVNRSAVMHLELSEMDSVDNISQEAATASTGRVGSGSWQVAFPLAEKDPAALIPEGGRTKEANPQAPEGVPSEATNHVLPVTTGAGRTYLITLSSQNPQSMYLFQIPATSMTGASLKDTIRDKAAAAVSAIPESGKFRWSKVEVIQSNLREGEIERPDEQLDDFAVSSWEEYGDKFVLWGGRTEDQKFAKHGWIVSLD